MTVDNVFLAILLAGAITYGESTPDFIENLGCKDVESTSAIFRLKRYLFCDYDQDLRPTVNHKNVTSILFGLMLQSFEIDDSTNIIDLHSLTTLYWKDAHLTWTPSDYEGIEWLHVKSYEIWVPDITVHNAAGFSVDVDMPETPCWMTYKGNVYCVPIRQYNAYCTADHTWWPYDVMNCSVHFGSWAHSQDEIDFRLASYQVEGRLTMEKNPKNLEWELLRTYLTESVETSKFGGDFNSKYLTYHLILKRHANAFHAPYTLPALVLMIMTLLALWLEPKSMERMIVANLNFISHVLCVQYVHYRVPYNGSHTPKISLFYQGSLILATASLILTSILRHVQEMRSDPPAWISSSTASILRSKLGQILLVSILDPKVSARIEVHADDNTDLVCSNAKESVWGYVAILIGWLAFLAAFITYIGLLAAFLPTSTAAVVNT